MDETIGLNVSLSDSDFNLCILGLSYNLAGCEPLRYIFSYCSLLKKPFLFKVRKNLGSFPSLPIVGSEGNFKNSDVSLIISYKLDIYIVLLTIITPLPLSDFVISMKKYLKKFDKNKESSYIQYWDVSNLYGWTISQIFSVNSFKWMKNTSQFNEDFIKNYNKKSNEGYFLEVDVQYIEKLHEMSKILKLIYITKLNMSYT